MTRRDGIPEERLHRLHDGELGVEERRALEAALDDDARLRLGAIDDMCSRMDQEYARDGQVRAALDQQRDAQRAIAAGERNGVTT